MFSADRHYVFDNKQAAIREALNTDITEKVDYVNGLITASKKAQGLTITKPEEGTVMLIGYKAGGGFSKKNHSDFKIAHLFYAKPVQKNDTANFSMLSSKGFEVEKVDIKVSLVDKLSTLDFPIEVKLQYELKSGFGNRNKWQVSDVIFMS